MGRRLEHHGRTSRRRWLAASSLAMATAMLQPAPLLAQTTTVDGVAVKASATYATGSATYTPGTPSPTGTATDLISVNSGNTLINWVPFDTASAASGGPEISFLPAGNGLGFIGPTGSYTVVNRILPADSTRAVRFDGQVFSFTQDPFAIGGNIYFFSPGGIIVGGTGRFDVGSLLLTTSDITLGTSINLAASNAGSFVRVDPWAAAGEDMSPQIELINQGSYLALVAQRVEQRGWVDVNGSVAYVAAESATMTISNALFDIVVGTGTGDTRGVVHSGLTTGPASTGTGDDQRIYMTAISKNDAITMLVGGQLGYAQAAQGTANGSIVLLADTRGTPGGGSIEVGPTAFSSDVAMTASDTVALGANGIGNDLNFGRPGDSGQQTNARPPIVVNATISAGKRIDVSAGAGGNVTVVGNLALQAGTAGAGGTIDIRADDVGRNDAAILNGLFIFGDFSASVAGQGANVSGVGGSGGDAFGGTISVDLATGGDLFVVGATSFDASAQAGFGEGRAGNATGGSIDISMTGANSRIGAGGSATIDASARWALNPSEAGPLFPAQGGTATGGDVTLSLLDGSSQFGSLTLNAFAEGSVGTDNTISQDNAAFGGNVLLDYSGGTHDVTGALTINASATAGPSSPGDGSSIAGTVERGLVDIGIDGAALTIGSVSIDASTDGDSRGSAAGDGIVLAASNGATVSTGSFSATALHDNRASRNPGIAGNISVSADAASLDLGSLDLVTTSTGNSSRPSDKTAGAIAISAANGSTVTASDMTLTASAVEGDATPLGRAVHSGGTVSLLADGSTIAIEGSALINTFVQVPHGGDMAGAVSSGGDVTLRQLNDGAGMTFGNLSIQAGAFSFSNASAFVGDGGNAAGGDVTIDVQSGGFSSGFLFVDSSAQGHVGGSQVAAAGDVAGAGGLAQGGAIALTVAGESFSPGSLLLGASATGGTGGTGTVGLGAIGSGAGGAAEGGAIEIQALSGTFDIDNFQVFTELALVGPSTIPPGAFVVDASAQGGEGGFGRGTDGGTGGDATGGSAVFTIAGSTVTFATPSLVLEASAYGGRGGSSGVDFLTEAAAGAGGAGGNATGGTAAYAITSGSTNLSTIIASAFARGGSGGDNFGAFETVSDPGGDGGNALGGTATATLGVADSNSLGLSLNATALGGYGGFGTAGTAGGDARGGTAQLDVVDAAISLNSLAVDASAMGGDSGYAGGGIGAPGGDGGDGRGGNAGIDVFGLGASLAVANEIDISSTGQGAAGTQGGSYYYDAGNGGAGGSGTGGNITLSARDGATLALSSASTIDARGFGAAGGGGGSSYSYAGGTGGAGGDSAGGSIQLTASGGGTVSGSAVEGAFVLSAAATGGLGGDRGSAGSGGTAGTAGTNGRQTGGSVGFSAQGTGSLVSISSDLFVDVAALGSFDSRTTSSGADALGGKVSVDALDGGTFSVAGGAVFDASAIATIGTASLGNARGGTIDVTMSGTGSSIEVGGGLAINVSAIEFRTGDFSFAAVSGGNITGGTATLDFSDGSASVVGDLLIDASASFGNFESSGRGGTATAGDVTLINDGAATLSLADVIISAYAQGSYGGYYGEGGGGGAGGAGGDAFGGDILISNQGTGSLSALSLLIDSSANGGRGGNGGPGNGGAGGSGTAGTAALLNGSDFAVQDLTIAASGTGGRGGPGSLGFVAGVGGQGTGGAVTLSTSTTMGDLSVLRLQARGIGGSGNTASGDFTTGGDGSQGGDGMGGSVLLELSGAGTVLPNIAEFNAYATGFGGDGGYGSYGYTNGGNGGNGGTGTGGELSLASRTGATIELTGFISSLSADGFGGLGGRGGTGGYGDGVQGASGGIGGNGGVGRGGELNLVAQGGSILGGEIELTAAGRGGAGGAGGYSTPGGENYGSYAPDGLGGGGAGGLVTLQALEGSPGVITLGAVTIDGSGFAGDIIAPTTGGSIVITDASTDAAGLITMGSLTATALGAVAPAAASFTMSGDSGPITVTGSTTVDVVGDIAFTFAGTGRLAVGGVTTLSAGGDITVTHLGNTTNVTSMNSAGNFTATAGGDFLAGDGTIVASGAALSITAQNISYATLIAGTGLTLNAINGSINGSISGLLGLISGGFIDLDATGAVAVGDAESESGFTADAGTDVSFDQITNSNNDLAINAGGNVSGVTATNDAPAGSSGGGRVIVTAGGDAAITNRLTSVSDSVLVDAGGDVAIGQIGAGSSVSVTGGGAVSLGRVDALVAGSSAIIRGASVELDRTNVAQDLIVEATSGDIIASANLMAGGLLDLDSAGGISFASMEGDVVELDAPGAIAGGNVTGGLTVTIGGAVAPSSVSAGSVVAIDGPVAITAGSMTVNGPTSFSSSVTLTALDGDLVAGQVTAGTDITATAAGNVDIGGASSGLATRITGSSIRIGPADAGTLLRLNATGGSVTGTAYLDAGTLLDIDATQAVSFVDGDAATSLEIDAGTSVEFRRLIVSSGDLRVAAGTSLTGTSAINTAPAGSAGLNRVILSAGGGDLTLSDTARSTDDGVFLSATGDLFAGTIDAGQNAQAFANGAVVVGTFNSALGGVLQGASVAVDDGTVGGNLSITATASDISGAGAIDVGQAIDLNAAGNIGFGSITANTGFTADAGGSILFGNASTADNNLTFLAGGDIDGNSASNLAASGSGGDDWVSLTAGGSVMLSGASRAENNFTVRGTDVSIGTIDAAVAGTGSVDVRGIGAVAVDGVTTAGVAAALIEGASVVLGTAATGGNLRLNATAGNAVTTGAIAVGGAADFDASGNIALGSVSSATGFTADAGGDITFADVSTADNNLVFNAGGNIVGGSARNLAAPGNGGDDSVSLTAVGGVVLTGLGRAENSFTVRGASASLANVSTATGGVGSIDIQVSGLASVGNASTAGGASALIEGASVALNNGTIGGNLRLNATAGDVSGTGTITLGGAADFDATGTIGFGSITAATGFTANAGGDITFVNAATSDNNLVFVAGGSIAGTSASNLAANGNGGDDSVSLTAGGNLTLTGSSRAENNFIVRAATASLGGVTAATGGVGSIDIVTTGAANVASVSTGGAASALIQGSQVTLGDAATGGNLRLNAAAGALDVTGAVTVGGAADLDAAGSITFGSIAAGTGFTADAGADILFAAATTGDNNMVFAAGGNISGVTASNLAAAGNGGDDSVSLTAGGSVTLTGASRAENNYTVRAANASLADVGAAAGGVGLLDIQATGLADVGTATTGGIANALIQGAQVALENGQIGGNLRLNATSGDIDGTGAIAIGGAADFDAVGSIRFGSITAGTGFTADAGQDIVFADAATTDNNLVFVAGGNIAGSSASNLAANGNGGDDSVSLTAGGSVMLSGASRAENNFTVRAGSASLGGLAAATGGVGSLDIRVSGLASISTASTAGGANALIEGASVALSNGAIGGNLRLNATAGDVSGTGTITLGGAADFDATGNVGFGSITAGTGFTANAGGNIAFAEAVTSDNNLIFVAGGNIAGTSASNLAANGNGGDDSVSLTAGGSVMLSGASRAENNFTVRAATASLGGVAAATGGVGSLDIRVSGLASVGTASTASGASALIEGARVALGSGSIGGNLRLNATAGDVSVAGATAVGGAADLDATGMIGLASLAAGSGITANAGTDILFGDATTADGNLALVAGRDILGTRAASLAPAGSGGDDSVSLNAGRDVALAGASQAENGFTVIAGGVISGGDFTAGGLLTLDGGSIAIGLASADRIVLASDLDIGFAGLVSPNTIGLIATNGTITGGDIDSAGDVTLSAQELALGNVAAGGSLGATAAGGDASFVGVEAAGNVTITATGTPTLGSLVSGGDTTIVGASAALASGTIGGDLSLTATSGAIDATGSLAVGGGIALTAAGDIAFGELWAAGGDFIADAGGAIGFGTASASGSLDFAADAAIAGGNLAASGGMTLEAGSDIAALALSADGSITANAGGALTLGSAIAGDGLDLRAGFDLTIADAIGGTVALRSANGAVTVTRDIESTFSGDGQQALVSGATVLIDDINGVTLTLAQATQGDIDIVAAGDIGIVDAEAAGGINLVSTGGDVRVTLAHAGKAPIVPAASSGAIGLAGIVGTPSPGDISVNAAGLAQGRFIASGDIGIAAGTTIDLNGAEASGSIALDSGGSTRIFAPASAGANIAIQSGGDVRVTGSQASLEAGNNLVVAAQGIFDTQGFAYGATVSIAAADVVIGSSGQVGDGALTQSITFASTGAPVVIGGQGQQSAFSLDAQEFGRVRGSGDLSVLAPSGAIEVRALDVLAGSGGALGTAGTLLLDAQGGISITGALEISGAGGDTQVALRAGDLLWIDSAAGNLRIENSSGAATGSIDVLTGRFVAASAGALGELAGLTPAQIDARLAQNDGVLRADGFIQAGALQVVASEAFLVQNSGGGDAPDDRRGLAVGALTVQASGTTGPLIVVNGTVGGATGTQALAAADLTSSLDPASTFNGCLIAGAASCGVAPPPEPTFEFVDPAHDLIEEEFDPGLDPESLEDDLQSQLIGMAPSEEFQDDPLIDDPVTGAGNEDLWTGEPECEPGTEGEGLCPVGEAAEEGEALQDAQ